MYDSSEICLQYRKICDSSENCLQYHKVCDSLENCSQYCKVCNRLENCCTLRYVIVQRTVYSIVKYNVCDSKGKNWYIKHCYLEYNQIQQDLPISVFHMKKSVQKTITDIFISESVEIIFNSSFEKIPTLPFSVNLTTFFSATFSFLSGGVMSILERPFLRGDRCDILWLLCVGTTDSSSLSLSSEADLKINVIMRLLRELVI